MAFPVSKSSIVEVEMIDGVNPSNSAIVNTFFDRLQNHDVEKLTKEQGGLSFVSRNSLFKIPYQIYLHFTLNEKLKISYRIGLIELLKACVIVAILTAFFASMRFERFIILFVLSVSGFYAFNVFIIEMGVKRLLNEVFEKTPYAPKEQVEVHGRNWISEPSCCPACGSFVDDFQDKCPSCKLSLPVRKGRKQHRDNHTTRNETPRIKYIFKEKKD